MISSLTNDYCFSIAYCITAVALHIICVTSTCTGSCLYIRWFIGKGMSKWLILFFFICFIRTDYITIRTFQIILGFFCACCRCCNLIRKFCEIMLFVCFSCIICHRIICKCTIYKIRCIPFHNRIFCTICSMDCICRKFFCFCKLFTA